MDINNIDVLETLTLIQSHVKFGRNVTFRAYTLTKMNFIHFFYIVQNQSGIRVFPPKNRQEFYNFMQLMQVDGQPIEIIYKENPSTRPLITCPVCNGSKIVNNTACMNCGGQYPSQIATGEVMQTKELKGCIHNYEIQTITPNHIQHLCYVCSDAFYTSN